MDDNKIFNDFGIVLETVKELETKLNKNEHALLLAFSHLYGKLNEIEKTIEENSQTFNKKTELIENSIKTYESSLQSFEEKLKLFQEKLKLFEEKIKLFEEKLNNIKTIEKPNKLSIEHKKIKRHRPWHYFFTKRIKYKKLLKEKIIIENEITERLKEKLRIEEEQRKLKEEQIRKELENKRKEEEIKRKERQKESQKAIEKILKRIYDDKGAKQD